MPAVVARTGQDRAGSQELDPGLQFGQWGLNHLLPRERTGRKLGLGAELGREPRHCEMPTPREPDVCMSGTNQTTSEEPEMPFDSAP